MIMNYLGFFEKYLDNKVSYLSRAKAKWFENRMLRSVSSKTRSFCPSETKAARFQAPLSSPFGRGTMPAQPSNGFFTIHPELSI